MKQSITQNLDYGCGVACFAFVCNMTFEQALMSLGKKYSVKHGWRPSDLIKALTNNGIIYKNNYVRKRGADHYPNGTIVLIERSAQYPVGHYLVLSQDGWMDPWINFQQDKDITRARSGYRTKLPGKVLYALTPV